VSTTPPPTPIAEATTTTSMVEVDRQHRATDTCDDSSRRPALTDLGKHVCADHLVHLPG
jgi:hypothetical protein